jgi:EAL domain-containing protein (putative c-di-GMP-specific phosphodiesterase class I)
LLGGLSDVELGEGKAILGDKGSTFNLGMLSRRQDLATLTAIVQGEWLLDMLRENRLAVHFQPIVSAVDPGEVFAYECLLHGFDDRGALVSARRMFESARRARLLFNLDRAARIKAICEASELAQSIFINFNPASIYDPAYCLRSTMGAIERSGLWADKIVFEVTESEEIKDSKHLRNTLDFYRKSGLRVASTTSAPAP